MKKIFFSFMFLLFLTSSTTVFAQDYVGLSLSSIETPSYESSAYSFLSKKKKNRGGPDPRQAIGASLFAASDGQGSGFYGLTYNFAYPISEIGNGGLFIALNPSIGLSGSANSRTGGSFSFGVDLPLLAELHFGEADAFGGLVGLGFGYSYMSSSEVDIAHKALGPVASAGLRIPIAGKVYLVRASYQLNLTKKTVGTYTTGNVLGLAAAMTF